MPDTNRYQSVSFDYQRPVPTTGKKPAPAQPAEYVRTQEFAAMMNALNGPSRHDMRASAALALMYYVGMRRSEVANLTRDRLHHDTNEPHVEVRWSKFGKGRNIPLDARAVDTLKRWLQHAPPSDYVICTYASVRAGQISKGNPPGSQATGMTIWAHVGTAKRRAKITRRIKPHMFRHAAATNWLRDGFNLREVQYLLGHKNLHTTQKYLHVRDEDVARKMYALGTPDPIVTPAPPILRTTKACDWCAEDIKIAAVICRYCQRDVSVAV